MAGQTINDRFLAARHSIAGQGLAKAVCKATTEEMISPKKKHLDYLINCTNEPNVSIPQLATLLIERSQNTSWVVVFKALLTTHHLMCNGNERFTQFMASSSTTFQLTNFLDKGGVQGYDMSSFIRRYAAYLNEKAMAYRIVAFDFCKVKRGKEDGVLRTMGTEKLLKTLPALQNQLDALLEFNCTSKDLTNSVIHVCFMFLFRDLIRLFACYNDAIINLLEKFFDMNKKQSREALELYKKFLIRMDRVGEFLRVAENVGIEKGDIPDLTKAPSSLLDALEQHILTMEGKKGSSASTPITASNAKQIKSGVSMLSSTSTAFGTAATNSTNDGLNGINATDIDEALRQRVLAEEEAAMNQYKSKVQPSMSTTSTNSSNSSVVNNPFLSLSENDKNHSAQSVDLFTNVPATSKASDDLLQLSNPFSDAYSEPQPVVAATSNNLFLQPQIPYVQQQGLWLNNGFLPQQPQLAPQSPQQTPAPFVSESAFSTVFGNQNQNSVVFSVQAAFQDTSGAKNNPFMCDLEDVQEIISFDNKEITDPSISSLIFEKPEYPSFPTNENKSFDNKDVDNQGTSNLSPEIINTDNTLKAEPNIETEKTDEVVSDENLDNNLSPVESNLDVEIVESPVEPKEVVTEVLNKTVNKPPRPPPPSLVKIDDNLIESKSLLDAPESRLNLSIDLLLDISPNQLSSLKPLDFVPDPPISQNSPQKLIGITDFDALGNVLQPVTSNGTSTTTNAKNSSSTTNNGGSSGVLTGDLESSLASLAENLSINNRPAQPKGVPWNSPGKVSSNWTPQPMAATNGAGYKPMGQGMTSITPAMTPSLYQPQVALVSKIHEHALQTVRPMPMGMMPTMGMNVPMSYPAMGTIPPGSMSPNVSVLSPQIPQQPQQSLLFH